MSDPALQITGLNYSYTNEWTRAKIHTLKDINFELRVGECFGFLGHNGAGKTTTIKCVLGLIRPQSGSISVFGIPHWNTAARALIGYLPEHPYFYDQLTVLETMRLYACLAGIPHEGREQAIEWALARVRLGDRRRSRMRTLSKGLMQCVALAQAIVHKPKLLILDEPFSGLDPLGRKDFRELFCELKEQGTTILMSSHILGDVEFLCDRASIMVQGHIKGIFDIRSMSGEAAGEFELAILPSSTEALQPLLSIASRTQAENRLVRLYFASREKAEQALHKALHAQLTIESFEFVHGSLEELFVNLVKQGSEKNV